ncbi:MAG TPA: VOC family protein [Thermoanaerobaculia bacterium]|nr:VOC family protein [Thermoanaerobaculia bacterium]
MAGEQKALGKFVWHDLMTTEVDNAVAYYTALLGWGIKEVEMEGYGAYKMIHAAGTEHGGFVQLGPEDAVPPHWISYATVDDVDAATAKAVELGGQAPVPGMDIPGVGRFGVIMSPTGAAISPYKSSTSSGEEGAEIPQMGTFCWHELLAADPQRDAKFFCEIFGWRTEEVPMGEMGTYTLFKRLDTGKDAGGMMPKPADAEGPSSWLPYVLVENADATAAKVGELGGKIYVQPMDIPGVGRFLVTSDPQGAMIAFLQPPA